MGKLKLLNAQMGRDGSIESATHIQEVSGIMEFNQRSRNEDAKTHMDKHTEHIGRIDMATWLRLRDLGIADDPKALKEYLKINTHYKVTDRRI